MLNGEKFTLCKNYRQLIEWSVTYIIWKFLKGKQKISIEDMKAIIG